MVNGECVEAWAQGIGKDRKQTGWADDVDACNKQRQGEDNKQRGRRRQETTDALLLEECVLCRSWPSAAASMQQACKSEVRIREWTGSFLPNHHRPCLQPVACRRSRHAATAAVARPTSLPAPQPV